MPIIRSTIERGFSLVEKLPVAPTVLSNKYGSSNMTVHPISSYVHSGVELIVSYGGPVVDVLDKKIDGLIEMASDVKNVIVQKYNNSKEEVITKAKDYKTAVSATLSNANSRVEDSVKQAPEVVRSLSNKAVSLTKQGLEISLGQEKTESVLNSVKTHTPKFVSSFLSLEQSTAVAAH